MTREPPMWHVPSNGNYMIIIKPMDSHFRGEKLTGLPTLEELREGVQGDIEIIPHFNRLGNRGCVAFCDEHGKQKNSLPNQLAQMLWSQSYGRRIYEDILVGQVVIIVGTPSFLAQL